MKRAFAVALTVLALAGSARVTPVRAQVGDPLAYGLIPDLSHWDYGCFGPCECPVITRGLSGRFSLVPDGNDPLYSYYNLLGIQWTITTATGSIAVSGSGRYQLGGEFALMHRLTLDLTVGGAPIHFDSGLIQGGGEWPEIKIDCAAHGFACHDTVVTVDAKPGGTSGTTGVGPVAPIAEFEPRPNPFRAATTIHVSLRTAAIADLRIFDVAGRLQRVLISGQPLAGDRAIEWDGLRADGMAAPPGLYLARLQTSDGVSWRRLVRLR